MASEFILKQMKRQILLFLLFFTSLRLYAQVIQQNELVRFNWFTDNSNKSFYKSDTISLIRITNYPTDSLELNRQYKELDYNEDKNITRLNFRKNNDLNIIDVDVKNWTESNRKGKWTWKFDQSKQLISFYFKGKLHSVFSVKEKVNDKRNIYNFLILKLVRLN